MIDDVLTDGDNLLAIPVLWASHHIQKLQHNLPFGLDRPQFIEVVFQEFPDEMEIEGTPQFKDSNDGKDGLQF